MVKIEGFCRGIPMQNPAVMGCKCGSLAVVCGGEWSGCFLRGNAVGDLGYFSKLLDNGLAAILIIYLMGFVTASVLGSAFLLRCWWVVTSYLRCFF
jgi:hypothetical protein